MIEAGLGGRYDATNVIPSRGAGAHERRPGAHALAGPDDPRHRGGEARGACAPGSTLVIGPDLRSRGAACCARETPAAQVVVAAGDRDRAGCARRLPAAQLRAGARRRGGVARRARRRRPCALPPPSTLVPGRFEVVGSDPETVIDGAHNPAGMRALAESLPEWLDGRELVARRLDPGRQGRRGDAAGAASRTLRTSCSPATRTRARCRPRRCSRWRVSSASRRSAPSATRAPRSPPPAIAAGPGGRRSGHRIDLPDRRSPASRGGPGSDAVNDETPSVLSMIAIVAVIVAVVILVFFGIGYLFGRLFL